MNKILITVLVPKLEAKYDVFIPVNKTVYQVSKLIIDTINELNDNLLKQTQNYTLINQIDASILASGEIIKNTSLRNGSTVILI